MVDAKGRGGIVDYSVGNIHAGGWDEIMVVLMITGLWWQNG